MRQLWQLALEFLCGASLGLGPDPALRPWGDPAVAHPQGVELALYRLVHAALGLGFGPFAGFGDARGVLAGGLLPHRVDALDMGDPTGIRDTVPQHLHRSE